MLFSIYKHLGSRIEINKTKNINIRHPISIVTLSMIALSVIMVPLYLVKVREKNEESISIV